MLAVFFQSLLIGYSGAIMPGSLLTYTIDKSLKHGSKSGLIIALGHASLEAVLVLALFYGLGQFLSATSVQFAIAILGGIILIYLGGQMIKRGLFEKIEFDLEQGELPGKNLFLSGVLLSASNPYFLVWWAIVGLGLIMSAYTTLGLAGIGLFYLGHILADLSWYSGVSFLIAKTKNLFSLKVYRYLILGLGSLLLFFGLRFIFNAFQMLRSIL